MGCHIVHQRTVSDENYKVGFDPRFTGYHQFPSIYPQHPQFSSTLFSTHSYPYFEKNKISKSVSLEIVPIPIDVEMGFTEQPTPNRFQFQSTRSNDSPGTIRKRVFLCVCQLAFTTQEQLNAHKRKKHFFCEICNNKCYRNQPALDMHHQKAHPDRWCDLCRRLLDDPVLRELHLLMCHPRCTHCKQKFVDTIDLDIHTFAKHSDPLPPPASRPTDTAGKRAGKYYILLNVDPKASHQTILGAARRARIDAHPDRCHRAGLSAKTWAEIVDHAQQVGQAADTLSNPYKRYEYDNDVRRGRRE